MKYLYASYIMFFWEQRRTRKHLVKEMTLLPESGHLHMRTIRAGGLRDVFVEVDKLIPITKYDYWNAHKQWFKQGSDFDFCMIYANRTTKEIYVFEK